METKVDEVHCTVTKCQFMKERMIMNECVSNIGPLSFRKQILLD